MPKASLRAGVDERASLLAPEILPLFGDDFVRSCDLYEEYVFRLTCRVARTTGLLAACARPATAAEAIARAGLDPRASEVPVDWILRMLASGGRLRDDGDRYRALDDRPDLDPEELRIEQERHDPRALPSYTIAALAAEHYPAVLRGETTGERALFAAERLSVWASYFDNENVIYAIANTLAAMAADEAITGAAPSILELGGGLGSGADALCARFAAHPGTTYRFTEVSIPFLRRAQRTLGGKYPDVPFSFARLDMDRPFAEAGVAPGSFAHVHAVNSLHVAHDLAFTLGEIRSALCPGGTLVAGECLRPFPRQPVYIEFVFNLLEAFQRPKLVPDWRPTGGFLTPEQWHRALVESGFTDVRLLPDVVTIRDAYPSFIVAAITARRA
jgi:SAM-dependent methyltransferase